MSKRKFTPEFKRSAVALVVEQKYTRTEAARNLGIGTGTLDNWLHAHRKCNGSTNAAEELDLKKRVVQLERELAQTRMERDILKKATAYFAKEQL
jgi:transposase